MLRPCLAFLIGLCLLFSFFNFTAHAQQAGSLEQLYKQPLDSNRQDFVFTIEQKVDAQNPGIAIFKLDKPEPNENNSYTLRYFSDGHLEGVFPGLHLPYIFKRNFAGLKKGEHSVTFELRNEQGQVSVSTLTICLN